MRVEGSHTPLQAAGDLQRRPENPEQAAKQFEEVLVREFVRTMTKDLFKSSLSGEDGAGWVKAQGESQGDALTDVLTRHLVESGTMGIADMLLEKWTDRSGSASGIPGQTGLPVSVPGDEALRLQEMLNMPGEAATSLEEFLALRRRNLPLNLGGDQ